MVVVKNMERIKKRLSMVTGDESKGEQLGYYHQSLEDIVYQKVRDKIIYHELLPDERIIDSRLAEEFGVSRSLVRQALTILEKEELVVSIPRRGFYVKRFTEKDVDEIYTIRRLLESSATEMAVPNLSDKHLKPVEKIFEEARRDLEKGAVESTIEADISLHNMITNNCNNERLKKMIKQYGNFYIFYRIVDLSRPDRAKMVYDEHFEILEAVKARDVTRAKSLMEKHINKAKDIILENFNRYTFRSERE